MAYELRSLERALEILVHLGAIGRGTLTDLAASMDVNQTTLLRTVRVLERHGFIRRPSGGRQYALGTRLIELGAAAADRIDIVSDLRNVVAAISRTTSLTAHIGLYQDGMVTIVGKIDPPVPIVRYSTLGMRMPLHATAMGKAVLATMGPNWREETGINDPLPPYTRHTISDVRTLAEDVSRVRARGFSIELQEYNIGFSCVGTSLVFNGELFGISLSGIAEAEEKTQSLGSLLSEHIAEFVRANASIMTTIANDQRGEASTSTRAEATALARTDNDPTLRPSYSSS